MTLPRTIEDREYRKFVESPTRGDQFTAVEVLIGNDSVPVFFQEAGEGINLYAEANSVAGLSTITVLTYVVPAGKTFRLSMLDFSGENVAEYILDVNSSTQFKYRTYYTQFNGSAEFSALEYVEGDTIKIIVENKGNSVADFNANIQGRLADA